MQASSFQKDNRTFAAFDGRVDREAGMIRAVSVITEGPALGHGTFIDAKMLRQVRDAINRAPAGRVRVNADHWSGITATVGYVSNARINGAKVKADMTILESFGQREQLFEMAAELPETFGLSIFFDPDPAEANDEGQMVARLSRLFSVDIVTVPAANEAGLFSAKIDTSEEIMPADQSPPAAITPEQFSELKGQIEDALDAIKMLHAKLDEKPAAPTVEIQAPAAMSDADIARVSEGLFAKLQLTANAAKPANAAPAPQVASEPPAKPYRQAKDEFIGGATGLQRMAKARQFTTQHGDEAAYNAKHNLA